MSTTKQQTGRIPEDNRKISGRSAVPKYLHPAQINALLSKIRDPRDLAVFTVAYFRGLRASEVGMLMLSDYRADVGRLRVSRLKGSVSGEHLLTARERRALNAWLKARGTEPGPLFPSRVHRGIGRRFLDMLMKRYGERSGIPPDLCHFHTLKHSIATHLFEQGEDVAFVQDWLGHKDIRNTMIYGKITNRARDEMAGRVNKRMGL